MNVSNYVFFSKRCPICNGCDVRMCVDWDHREITIGCALCGARQTRMMSDEEAAALCARFKKQQAPGHELGNKLPVSS